MKKNQEKNLSPVLELNCNRIILHVRRAAKNKHNKITCGKMEHVHRTCMFDNVYILILVFLRVGTPSFIKGVDITSVLIGSIYFFISWALVRWTGVNYCIKFSTEEKWLKLFLYKINEKLIKCNVRFDAVYCVPPMFIAAANATRLLWIAVKWTAEKTKRRPRNQRRLNKYEY